MAKEYLKSEAETKGKTPVLKKEFDETVGLLNKNIKFILGLNTGVIVVLFVGVITILAQMYLMVMESNNFKTSTYQQTNTEINSIGNEINTIGAGLKQYHEIP